MRGIAGYVAPVGEAPSLSLVTRMRDVIQHRGPDSAGYRLDGPAALGMRRLKIIDLATGDQPIAEETGRSRIVFNGEIYNYLELRTGLLQRGHTLAPDSACRRVFSSDAVESVLAADALTRGGSRAAEKLWILLNFEYWHRMYLDNQFGKF
jgi:asparagine synthetase B (glutamine-hydrolysing)